MSHLTCLYVCSIASCPGGESHYRETGCDCFHDGRRDLDMSKHRHKTVLEITKTPPSVSDINDQT